MKRAIRLACVLLAAGCAAATGAFAANGESADIDPWMTDRYEIEIIVFRHRDQSRNTPEQAAPGELDYPLADLYSQPMAEPGARYTGPYVEVGERDYAQSGRDREPTVSFYLLELQPQFPDAVPLAGNRMQLGRVVDRLATLDAYDPLVHMAWLQAARPADVASPVRVESNPAEEFVVTGTVTLYKERYTHLEVDLELRQTLPEATAPEAATAQWPIFGDVVPPPDPSQVPLRSAAAPTYTLQESRRIRGPNSQYFDHPQFGVIARISKIELEDD